jgi:hypothetical protein
MDGRLYNWKADPLEQKPLGPAEGQSARRRLQRVLDDMAKVRAPKFNRFEPDGKPAY